MTTTVMSGAGLVAPPAEDRAALAASFQRGFAARRRPGRRRVLACATLTSALTLALTPTATFNVIQTLTLTLTLILTRHHQPR